MAANTGKYEKGGAFTLLILRNPAFKGPDYETKTVRELLRHSEAT